MLGTEHISIKIAKQTTILLFAVLFVMNPNTVLHLLSNQDHTEQFADIDAEGETESEKEKELDDVEDLSFENLNGSNTNKNCNDGDAGDFLGNPSHFQEISNPPPEA